MKLSVAIFLVFCSLISSAFAQSPEETVDKTKRDPFIPLVDSTGRVKEASELMRPAQSLLTLNISLKGIIWSKTKPLAIINNKIYREGDKIFEGLILEQIDPESVILNDRGEEIRINLRKKEKK
jgi:hypothetical protein